MPGRTFVFAIQSPFTKEVFGNRLRHGWFCGWQEMKTLAEQWGVEYAWHEESRELRLADPGCDLSRAEEMREKGIWPTLVWHPKTNHPKRKRYLDELAARRAVLPMFLSVREVGSAASGKAALKKILGKEVDFHTVKPVGLEKLLVQHLCPPEGTVLDAFAGSGTVGQAVAELNREENASRRFILIEKEAFAETVAAERLRRLGISFEMRAGAEFSKVDRLYSNSDLRRAG